MKPYTYGTKVKVAGRLGEWRVVRVKRTVQVEYRVKRIGKRFTEWVGLHLKARCSLHTSDTAPTKSPCAPPSPGALVFGHVLVNPHTPFPSPLPPPLYTLFNILFIRDRDYECVLEQNWAIMKKYAEVPV